MDSSRFRRRQTQTAPNKILLDGFSQRSIGAAGDPQKVLIAPRRVMADTDGFVSLPPRQREVDSIRFQTPEQTAAQDVQQPAIKPAEPLPAAAPPRLPRIDMGLPGDASLEVADGVIVRHSKWKAIRRWGLRVVVAGLVLIIASGSFLFSQGYLKLHKVFNGATTTAASLQKNVDPNLLKGEGTGRINVLLLGRGGGNHDAPDLTDTIMLASIDPVNHTETLMSVPRDLWVDIPSAGAMKINAAWETGEFKYLGKVTPGSTNPQAIQAGFDMVDQTVESVLGVTINYNVLVNFKAFQEAVDTVGGITVNVPEQLYDPTMAWENANNPILAQAGVQNFDGKHALIYVRSRETTSDFARSQRQRAVILAIKQKVKTLGTVSNPIKLAGLMNAFSSNVQTDFSLNDASRMYSIVKDIDDAHTKSISLVDKPTSYVTTAAINGQSTVQPLAGMFNYKDIQGFVRGQLKDPYILKENAKIMVLNGTTADGFGTESANKLKTYGYNVTKVDSAPTSGYDNSIVVDLSNGKDPFTKHYLEQHFNVTATTKLPDPAIQANGANFVIIVGSDASALN